MLRLEPQLQPGVVQFVVDQFMPSLGLLVVNHMDLTHSQDTPAAMRSEFMARCSAADPVLLAGVSV